MSYYLPNQPNYLVLIILFSVPGDSHARPGCLVSHYDCCSPKHPCCPLTYHFICFCQPTMTSNCDFFNYSFFNKPSTFLVTLNLQRSFTQSLSSSSFSMMRTPVLCVGQVMLCALTVHLTQSHRALTSKQVGHGLDKWTMQWVGTAGDW